MNVRLSGLQQVIEIVGEIAPLRLEQQFTILMPDFVKEIRVEILLEDQSDRLSFQWHDSIRSRGCFVPWNEKEWGSQFEIFIRREEASRGLMRGPIVAGPWRLDVSGINIRKRNPYVLRLHVLVEDHFAAYRWFRGDPHIHTHHSDGVYSMADTIRLSKRNDLQFICITDHNTTSAFEEAAVSACDGESCELLVMRGMEFTTDRGHANAIGLLGQVDWRSDGIKRTFTDVAYDTKAQNGLFSINHPFHVKSRIKWSEWDMDFSLVDCMEIWNGLGRMARTGEEEEALAKWNELLNRGYRITGIGGSDAVHPNKPDEHRPGNPSTYVYAERLTSMDILKGMKEGRVIISSGPMPHVCVATEEQQYPVGSNIVIGKETEVQIRSTFHYQKPHNVQIVKNGETLREVYTDDSGSIRMPIPAKPGDWVRLQYRDEDGVLAAFTNPFYFI